MTKTVDQTSISSNTNPKQTAEGVCKIIAGYGCALFGVESEYRAYSDAVTEYFSKRYGSYEDFKKTLADDPVGVAADISMLFTAGGGALRTAVKGSTVVSRVLPAGTIANGVGGAANILSQAGRKVGTVGKVADPLYWVGKALPKHMQEIITARPWVGTATSRVKTAVTTGGTANAASKELEK
ncbi:MAG: hypothetical protein FWG04_04295 [Desulfovibrionaceae bacterium]|nr:hypothetical protein [Desulfovibrionaceae bacterium]